MTSAANSHVAEQVAAPPETPDERVFTRRERILLWIISWAGFLAIRLIGLTLRTAVSADEGVRPGEPLHPSIFAFWHRCVFPAAHIFRNQGVAVMTSRSFDGEYIARVIERNGYVAVRGSSSRGGVPALMTLHRLISEGHSAAFTIDGPRGPRFVAKPGAVLLARNTGVPIVPFYVAVKTKIELRSWDRSIIPLPFSRALLRATSPVYVPRDATDDDLPRYLAELQSKLDAVRDYAEVHVGAL